MGDQLERYINENREAFEADHSLEKWDLLSKRLDKNPNLGMWIWRAAAMVLFVLSAGLLIERTGKSDTPESLTTEVAEVELYYTTMIRQKIVEMREFGDLPIIDDFIAESSRLDSTYQELRKLYKEDINNEKIVAAMINNLQLQINILNQQLEILQQLKEQDNEYLYES